jgi:hypothetical protein
MEKAKIITQNYIFRILVVLSLAKRLLNQKIY